MQERQQDQGAIDIEQRLDVEGQNRQQDQEADGAERQIDVEGQEAVLQGLSDARSRVQEASVSGKSRQEEAQENGTANGTTPLQSETHANPPAETEAADDSQTRSSQQDRDRIAEKSPPGS